jgi:hypothetical protein
MATPLLTATPGAPPTYNPSMAETFSWVPVEGAGRPLYAQATYLANPEDIKVSLSADNINVSLDELELNTDQIEGLITDSNARLNALTAVDYATSAKQDLTNTLLDALTAKETTISLDVSAINLNTDEVEIKLDEVNTNLNAINDNTNAVEGLISGVLANTDTLETQIDTSNARLLAIANNTSVGTTSLQPLFVNTGALQDTIDSISIDKSISQTATTSLTSQIYIAGSRKVYNLFGISTAGSDQYIQLYDTGNQAPSGTPIGVFFVPSNSNFSFDINRGLNFTGNVLVVNSITPVTYTQGNDDLFMTVIHN